MCDMERIRKRGTVCEQEVTVELWVAHDRVARDSRTRRILLVQKHAAE